VLGEVSVYPIDTRGLQVDPAYSAASGRAPSAGSAGAFSTRQFFEHNDLDQVAEATGGHAFYNTNGIKQAVAEVIDTGSSYYTLSYYPTNKKWDGSYRNLKLELPGGRSIATATTRRPAKARVRSPPRTPRQRAVSRSPTTTWSRRMRPRSTGPCTWARSS
jgi:VWFA-related protein